MRSSGSEVVSSSFEKELAKFDYELPAEQIAISPASAREKSRMLVFERNQDVTHHEQVSDLPKWLGANDLLVLNQARVDPVRIFWIDHKGRSQEMVLLQSLEEGERSSKWEAIVSGKGLRAGDWFELPGKMRFCFRGRKSTSLAEVELEGNISEVRSWCERYGFPPVPPYVRKERERRGEQLDWEEDKERYQTVFARRSGAVAAPTAGLHFSAELLDRLKGDGVEIAQTYLAVGWGTFQPLSEEHWEESRLHREWCEISRETAQQIQRAKEKGKRIVAVGTTVVRNLAWWDQAGRPTEGKEGWCDLFLRPPWSSSLIGAMLTNFHLPRSSLMALVAGFLGDCGEDRLIELYRLAVAEKYRFYSYGDCMLIL